MSESAAGLAASRALGRAYEDYLAYRVKQSLFALWDAVERKRRYDPNQPRVPAGNPDGGQWTDEGDGGGSPRPSLFARLSPGSDLDSDRWMDDPEQLVRVAQVHDPSVVSDVSPRPRNLPRTVRDLSDIPLERPTTTQLANAIGKFVAYEAADYIMKQSGASVGTKVVVRRILRNFLLAAEIAPWIKEDFWPFIEAYNDPPKTLKELQDGAAKRRPGYDIHHIVEQNSMQLGEEARINSRENLVSIPTFKHHLITGWYMTKNKRFGRVSPRRYLKDKSWEKRFGIGLEALVRFRVLQP